MSHITSFTQAQLDALLTNHVMTTRVVCLTGSENRGDIPIIDGKITATFTSQVNRTGDITVSRRVVDAGLLNPLTDHVIIYTGIPGILDIPIFYGRPDSYTNSNSHRVTVRLIDQCADIVRARFEQPWEANTGALIRDEMVRMILDVSGDFFVDISQAPAAQSPVGLWEEDRAGALDQMATAINCIWQSDRVGGFVVAPNPFLNAQAIVPVLELIDGPNGNLNEIEETISRELIANSMTVVVERTDNSPPIRVTVRDSNPTSLTRWGGLFGKQNQIRKIRTPLTAAAAGTVAVRMLTQSLALARSFRINTPHFPILDPADVFLVTWNGVSSVQVVESISYPLRAIQTTTISSRELRLEEDFEMITTTLVSE